MRRTLAILAAFALLATTLAVAQAPMSGPPKVLQIVREEVKVGKGPGHEKNEAAWLQAMIAAKYTTHVLTVTAVTGPTEEWFISGFDSFAAWEKDSKLFDAQPLKGVMDNYGAKDAEFISESRLITARYRPDLSYHPDVNIGEYKYFAVGILRLKIGHDPDDAFKAVIGAHTKANDDVHFATYMVNSGMPYGVYLIFSPLKSLAEWDQPPNPAYMAALKDAGFAQLVKVFG